METDQKRKSNSTKTRAQDKGQGTYIQPHPQRASEGMDDHELAKTRGQGEQVSTIRPKKTGQKLCSTPLLDTHSQTSLGTSPWGNPCCHFAVSSTF